MTDIPFQIATSCPIVPHVKLPRYAPFHLPFQCYFPSEGPDIFDSLVKPFPRPNVATLVIQFIFYAHIKSNLDVFVLPSTLGKASRVAIYHGGNNTLRINSFYLLSTSHSRSDFMQGSLCQQKLSLPCVCIYPINHSRGMEKKQWCSASYMPARVLRDFTNQLLQRGRSFLIVLLRTWQMIGEEAGTGFLSQTGLSKDAEFAVYIHFATHLQVF